MLMTANQLKELMPNAAPSKLAAYLPFIQQAMQEFEIDNNSRETAFLAQLAHESGELRYMEEIASGAAYEGRKDLGNTQAGDGQRYKGRGPIQLTGRANYKKYGTLLGLDLLNNPTIAAKPEVGFRIAGQFWKLNGLNELADRQDFRQITKRINGGYNGLEDRLRYYNRAKRILSETPETAPAYPGVALRQGSKSSSVKAMQQRLADLGFAISIDGNFGPGTRTALMKFQSKKGLRSDGVCGPATWRILFPDK